MKRFSLFLSYAFCVVGFLAVLGMCVAFPIVGVRFLATVPGAERFAFVIYLLTYLIFTLVLVADACLVRLLIGIRKNRFFNEKSVRLLLNISWAAIFAGFLAIPLFFLFIREALFISFVALFMGVVLRVVAQVIRKANEIKEENDATI
ncbi:MAG: DUF2975 domain-containing protein [Clostridia bacterium]|nr:DUF2975 domain-containing protein [Clostridia bacterium]